MIQLICRYPLSALARCGTTRSFATLSKSYPGPIARTQKRMPPMMNQISIRGLKPDSKTEAQRSVMFYTATIGVIMFAASFAAIPLYRMYCQATGKGGQAIKEKEDKIVDLKVDTNRPLTVNFVATTHNSTPWKFQPVQDKIEIYPGQTALAFYRVTNPLDEPVIGVATYVVLPYEAGAYLNKIQCFCFEEQILQPHEDVFMPVLFYIDPEFSKDYRTAHVTDMTLSYTFFRSKDGELIGLDEPIELKKH